MTDAPLISLASASFGYADRRVVDGVTLPPGNHLVPEEGVHGVTVLELPERWGELEDPTRLRLEVDAVGRGLSAQPADGGLGILDRGGEFCLTGEPVGNRDDGETARGERLRELGQVAALAPEPAAAVEADDRGQRCAAGGGAMEIELEFARAVAGVSEAGVRLERRE